MKGGFGMTYDLSAYELADDIAQRTFRYLDAGDFDAERIASEYTAVMESIHENDEIPPAHKYYAASKGLYRVLEAFEGHIYRKALNPAQVEHVCWTDDTVCTECGARTQGANR
jgi:hypothetical protein